MSIEDYWKIILDNEDEIRKVLRHKIKDILNKSIKDEDFEEVYLESISVGAERVLGDNPYKDYDHVKNSVATIGWRYYRDKSMKAKNEVKRLDDYKEAIENTPELYDTDAADKAFENRIAFERKIKDLYPKIETFVKDNFDFISYGLFIQYVRRKYFEEDGYKRYSEKQLAIDTGFKLTTCRRKLENVKKAVAEFLKGR